MRVKECDASLRLVLLSSGPHRSTPGLECRESRPSPSKTWTPQNGEFLPPDTQSLVTAPRTGYRLAAHHPHADCSTEQHGPTSPPGLPHQGHRNVGDWPEGRRYEEKGAGGPLAAGNSGTVTPLKSDWRVSATANRSYRHKRGETVSGRKGSLYSHRRNTELLISLALAPVTA